MFFLKYILLFLVGTLFLVITKIIAAPDTKYILSEKKHGVILNVHIDAYGTKFNIQYSDSNEAKTIQSARYKKTYNFSRGDTVDFRIAEYESGAKFAMIDDNSLVISEKKHNSVRMLFLFVGSVACLLALGMTIVSIIRII